MKRKITLSAVLAFALLLVGFGIENMVAAAYERPSAQWAKKLSVEDVQRIELCFSQYPGVQTVPTDRYEGIVSLLNSVQGRPVDYPAPPLGNVTSIYVTDSRGQVHTVKNAGGRYLCIDGDWFKPPRGYLDSWPQ